MPTTDVRIINQALSHLGHTIFIDDRSEDTQEVAVSDVHYDDALAYVLEDFWWGFARRFVTLGLVEDFSEVETAHKWNFSYRYPVDTVTIRGIVTLSGILEDSPDDWEIGSDDSGRLFYANAEDAVVEVTKLITDAALFPAMFADAMSWHLAFLMGPGLAKDKSIVGDMLRIYNGRMLIAKANDGNQEVRRPSDDSDAIRARA